MEEKVNRTPLWLLVCGIALLSMTQRSMARPPYGNNCADCHGSAGFGNSVPNAIFNIAGTSQSTIPLGAFGDPDRGEGPLPTYTATPGGQFTLSIQINDPSTYNPPFTPTRWAVRLDRVYTTDPDFQAGNPDPLTFRNDQLLLDGHLTGPDFGYPDPAPIPASSSSWSLYSSFSGDSLQYYASTGNNGHDWIGSFLFEVDVTVPSGVLPGWYDLNVSSAGWDYDQSFAFFDDQHFYLNVTPEPASLVLLLGCVGGAASRRRIKNRAGASTDSP